MTLRQRWKQTSLPNKLLIWTGAMVAFGTLFYAAAAAFQLWTMIENSRQTSEQAVRLIGEANRIAESMERALAVAIAANSKAERQAERSFRMQMRPYVIASGFDGPTSLVAGDNRASVTIKNVGKLPALQEHADVRTYRGNILLKSSTADSDLVKARIPLLEQAVSLSLNFTLSTDDILKITSGRELLRISGPITYWDVFKEKDPYETTVCLQYVVAMSRFAYCKAGNDMK